MPSVTKSIDVPCRSRTAYNQWTQFESFPHFMGGVESITQTDDTHSHWVTKIGGVTREFDTEITEQHPDERVAWKSTDGTTHAGVVTFHRLGDARPGSPSSWTGTRGHRGEGRRAGRRRRPPGEGRPGPVQAVHRVRGREEGTWRGDVDAPST